MAFGFPAYHTEHFSIGTDNSDDLWVAVREKATGKIYLLATLGLLVAGAYLDALDANPAKSVYKLFGLSLAFVFYALDLYDRAGDFKGLEPNPAAPHNDK